MGRDTPSLLRRAARSIRKREAHLFAHQAELRSVRTAPRLSRPSMGRDTLCLPQNSVASGRMGRGSDRRRIGSLRANVPGPPTTPVQRGPMASARRLSKLRSPRKTGRSGRASDAREPESRAPAQPTASDHAPPGTPGAQRLATSAAGKSARANGRKPESAQPAASDHASPGARRDAPGKQRRRHPQKPRKASHASRPCPPPACQQSPPARSRSTPMPCR